MRLLWPIIFIMQTPKYYIINHETLTFPKNELKAVIFPFHCLFWSQKPYPPYPPGKHRVWAKKGTQDVVPGRSPTGQHWDHLKVWQTLGQCFPQSWNTLPSNVPGRCPTITREAWSFQSIYGMLTRHGLAKAYKYVTTRVTLFQKHATLPRATAWIIRNCSREVEKKESHTYILKHVPSL